MSHLQLSSTSSLPRKAIWKCVQRKYLYENVLKLPAQWSREARKCWYYADKNELFFRLKHILMGIFKENVVSHVKASNPRYLLKYHRQIPHKNLNTSPKKYCSTKSNKLPSFYLIALHPTFEPIRGTLSNPKLTVGCDINVCVLHFILCLSQNIENGLYSYSLLD